jgi:hypothetical protein
VPNPENSLSPKRAANRPWKNGIGYVTRALFRDTGEWSDDPDYGTRVLSSGVTDEHGKIYDMKRFDAPGTRAKDFVKAHRESIPRFIPPSGRPS